MTQPDSQPMEVLEKDIRSFQEAVRNHSGYDFTEYSVTSLRRRLTKILMEYDMSMDQLIQYLETDSLFMEKTVKKLTVHTTELFRDPGIWKKLHTDLLPPWKDKSSIHVWHSGCSTGQEIFSMMMVLDDLGLLEKSHIYASDLNPDVLETARLGRYKYRFNQSYLENFDQVMLNGTGENKRAHKKYWKKYFTVDEARDTIQMRESLCSKPVYKKLDLVKDPNLFLVNFDLIICRNVIIYFNNQLQNRVFDLFYENLRPEGVLLLGVHESIIGPYSRKFTRKDPFYMKNRV
ncbi:MAG: CheR family methyltransferase [Bacteroidota bacterium]